MLPRIPLVLVFLLIGTAAGFSHMNYLRRVIQKGLEDSDFKERGLEDSDFIERALEDSNFNERGLDDSDFNERGLEDSDFNERGLEDSDFKERGLEDSDFNERNLEDSDFNERGLEDSDPEELLDNEDGPDKRETEPVPVPEPTGCVVNGKTYKEGDTYMIECNTCRCVKGMSACTRMACNGCTHDGVYYNLNDRFMLGLNTTCQCYGKDTIGCRVMPNPTPNHCYYNGEVYRRPQMFTDGCNRCFCNGNNLVLCTAFDCANPRIGCYWQGKKYKNGDVVKDQCNACVCAFNKGFMCSKLTCI